MLKQEYEQHIAEMSQRVRCEEWAELEKNKEDFLYDYQFLTIDFVYLSYNRSKYQKGIS